MPGHRIRVAVLALLLGTAIIAADAAPAPLIAYQGRLVEGGVVANGGRAFTFTILDPTDVQLWTSGAVTLTVSNGLYSTVLGGAPMPAIPASVLDRAGLKLHVTVAGQDLSPDVALVPGLQALRAWEAVDVTGVVALDHGGTGATTAAAARANLGLEIGVDVLAVGGSAANVTGTVAIANGGTGAATAAAARTGLGLAIGTDVLAPNGSAAGLTGFPVLNQDTTGTAANVTGTVAVTHGGTGATSLGDSRQPLLGNGAASVTAAPAPVTDDPLAEAVLGTAGPARKGVVIQGSAAQAANLQEWQNVAGAPVASVGAGGAAAFAGTLSVGSTTAPASGAAYINGNVGIGTNAPTRALGIAGNAAQGIGLERSSLLGAGGTLTVNAAGAGSGSTDANGGSLVLAAGTATGSGTGSVLIQPVAAGSAGTADNAPATKVTVSGSSTQFQHQYYASQYANGNSGAAATINFNLGNAQTITLTANCTLTLSNGAAGGRYLLMLAQDATGSRTVTWPANVRFAGNVTPTLTATASYKDIVTLYYDGSFYHAAAAFAFAP